jgi:hypothetical protein
MESYLDWWSQFAVVVQVQQKERTRLIAQWRLAFAGETKWQTGKPVMRGQDWHTFSHAHFPHLHGERAKVAFGQIASPCRYFVWTDVWDLPALACEGRVPTFAELKEFISTFAAVPDLYLAEQDVLWTFIVPHEFEMGPYFAHQ